MHKQCWLPLWVYLLHLVDILCLLYVELQDIQDTSVDVQHHDRDSLGREHFSDNTIGVLKLDGDHQLRCQDRSQLGGRSKSILWPNTTVLEELRLGKLQLQTCK